MILLAITAGGLPLWRSRITLYFTAGKWGGGHNLACCDGMSGTIYLYCDIYKLGTTIFPDFSYRITSAVQKTLRYINSNCNLKTSRCAQPQYTEASWVRSYTHVKSHLLGAPNFGGPALKLCVADMWTTAEREMIKPTHGSTNLSIYARRTKPLSCYRTKTLAKLKLDLQMLATLLPIEYISWI